MLSSSTSVNAQEVNARSFADSTSFLIGDPITVHVEIQHPKGITFQALVGDTVGRFAVLQRSELASKGETSTSTSFVVANYDSGSAILPPLLFLYSLKGDTATRTVATNPLIFNVRTGAVDTSQAIKDVKPPMTIPYTLLEILSFIGIILALAAAGYFGYRYWKKKQITKWSDGEYVPPSRPAHVLAFVVLGNLKEKRLWQQGLIKPYYVEISEIVRRYFENRYHVMALEETTDEIMKSLNGRLPDNGMWQNVDGFLRRADLVKFAKFQPTIPEHEEMMKVAFDVVERTKLVEIPVPAPVESKEMGNAGS
jgi:hypothetical protein